jgi:hypothetical protein
MKYYACRVAIKPTVYTEDTVYQAFVNTDTRSIRLRRLNIQLESADAGGTAKSIYGLKRIKGLPTGGDSLGITKYNTQDEKSMMVVLRNQAGLTMTGVTQDEYFWEGSIQAKTTGSPTSIEFNNNNGFILAPNEGVAFFADNTVIAGSSIHGFMEWVEE